MKWQSRIALLCAGFWCLGAPAAETLYAASIRSPIGGNPNVAGNLYIVDPETAAAKLVAPIRVGEKPIGVTGLAFHPTTRTLYGVTALLSPNYPHWLVRIDPVTGDATAIGDLGVAGSDISFDAAGTLFAWLRETRQLGKVDLTTGVATPLGTVGPLETVGGLALDSRGRAYIAATGANGTLDTVDTKTGAITKGPSLKDAPYPNGINSLSFSRGDELFAVNTNMGNPASTLLVKIDPATGAVRKVGALPNDSDALAFAPSSDKAGFAFGPGMMVLIGLAILLGAGVFFFVRRRR